MTTPDVRVEELITRFTAADACPARLLCDDHPADKVAFTVVESDLTARDLTYGELRERSSRLAAALAELGVGPGDAVGTLMGKSAELVVTVLAIWRRGAVHVPLFTAFAPAAIAMRLQGSAARLLIVDADQRSKLDPSADMPADAPWRVVTVGDRRDGDLSFNELVDNAAPPVEPVTTGPAAPLVMIFTSGTTGTPKGVPMPVRALAHMVMYLEYGYDVREQDVFWNAADPGWAYGLYYAIVAPLAAGRRNILLRAGFTAELIVAGSVRVRASPILRLRRTSIERCATATHRRTSRLRCASSAGEPLTPDLIPWAETTFGVADPRSLRADRTGNGHGERVAPRSDCPDQTRIDGHDHYRGTPSSCCRTTPTNPAPPGTLGRVAVDSTAPLFGFDGYHNEPARTAQRFTKDGRWYLTGDVGLVRSGRLLLLLLTRRRRHHHGRIPHRPVRRRKRARHP